MKNIVLGCALVFFVTSASAQRWQWPDNPKNIKVLPKTATGRELQRVMFSYTAGLGVRCTFCHVGEEGKDFSEFDFPSDAKPEKNEARIMIKMVNGINTEYLTQLNEGKPSSLEVSCMTCHHGNSRPILLEDKLKRTYDREGIDSTIKQYHTLRDQFYGGFTYNFKEQALMRLADKISEDSTKTSDVIQVLKLNIELYPNFAFSYGRLGGIYESQGNVQAAIETYSQALKIDPDNRFAKGRLERLQNKK